MEKAFSEGRPAVRARLFADLFCETAAFIAALFLRYVLFTGYFPNPARDLYFYRMLYVFAIAFYILVFYSVKGNRRPDWEMSPPDLIACVAKNHILLVVSLMAFLYFIKSSLKVSRTVLLSYFLIGTSLGIAARWLLRRRALRAAGLGRKRKRVLFVGDPSGAELRRIARLGIGQDGTGRPWDVDICGAVQPEGLKQDMEAISAGAADALYISAGVTEGYAEQIIAGFSDHGMEIYRGYIFGGLSVRGEMVCEGGGGAAAVCYRGLKRKSPVLGIPYVLASPSEAALCLIRHRKELSGAYCCFSNAHTAVMGWDDPAYHSVQEGAAYVFPDGSSIVSELISRGADGARRIAGPDFMSLLFEAGLEAGASHYFYGSTEATLSALREQLERKYPGIRIAGMYSPPFREQTEDEDAAQVEMINTSGADFIWIGLGAPKQELWMARHKGRLHGLMMGVGAGFDFHAGTEKRAAGWVQNLGLEWLWRLLHNPGRLLRRYVVTNTKFLLYAKILKK